MVAKIQLDKLRARIEAQNGTVLDNVEGDFELADEDADGKLRKGPVLVLRSIEEGSQLKLATPRPVTVLGSLHGQVFGAYRVKAGNLLSGRLEGCRHVEIVHNMGSKGNTNEDSWIVFEATSDPGFFAQAQSGLDKLRALESRQIPQREATARGVLMRSLKDVPYDIKVFVFDESGRQQKTVFALAPGRSGHTVKLDLMSLLRYLIGRVEGGKGESADHIDDFKDVLSATISKSIRLANSGGIGARLRKQRGTEVYDIQIEAVAEYLLPKLLGLWLKVSESYVQRVVDRLADAPMILKVDGQLAPFFQIEYPRWKFHVTGSRIVPEKVADCNIACQLGGDQQTDMSMTYNYIGEDDWVSQTKEVEIERGKACKLILRNGDVYLTELANHLFGPDLKETAAQGEAKGGDPVAEAMAQAKAEEKAQQ